ncbi:uncharacterized protein PFL1_01239 [Pseudozyma flocculosa PF-1]|uniref:LysM domain-containing protein n=1 Tax=Pseudozyma flocculosa TaxID=84751 RepID=A0A5C3EWC5_9BASI|nr:uncharacterized protein PFL1_01239 [Pseudozyma flocculosa PF-1]EPQ31050.1 hypothetical protein PFL1_01239 [Pseudozyma flocculosa PF-1]SPO35896.1 uncharacterized protein PSFLO_01367 [Pseudozyma flocculosa]
MASTKWSWAVLAVAASLLLPLSSQAAYVCKEQVSVKSGDTCDAICASNSASMAQLLLLNSGLDCSLLQIGQQICVRATTYDCQPVIQVQSGDYCYGIADANGITIDQFYLDNPGIDCNTIYPGYSVCVSPTDPNAPSPTPTSTTATATATTTTSTTSTSAPTPTSTACTDYTTVQAGETCDTICQRAKVTQYDLTLLNPDQANVCDTLQAGQALCVDGPQNTCGSTIEVKEGDYCYGMAEAAGLTLDEFLSLNPGLNCDTIYAGQVLCVAADSGTTAPPVADCSRFATIQPGDTCERIASRSSLTSVQLRGLNPGLDCSGLIPGQNLCSFSPSANVCPDRRIVKFNDTCYDLSQNASMSLAEWQQVNSYGSEAIDCTALPLSYIICQARGNASLPVISGTNNASSPRCSNCDYGQSCCTQYSSCAPLGSNFCSREYKCQENCNEDDGVTLPPGATNSTGNPNGNYSMPVYSGNCDACQADECCANEGTDGMCMPLNSWFCVPENGCLSNCVSDINQFALSNDPALYRPSLAPNYTFPAGDYSSTDGNPCGTCGADECCDVSVQCTPQANGTCFVSQGCLYNCLQVYQMWEYDEEDGTYEPLYDTATVTVKKPFPEQSPEPIDLSWLITTITATATATDVNGTATATSTRSSAAALRMATVATTTASSSSLSGSGSSSSTASGSQMSSSSKSSSVAATGTSSGSGSTGTSASASPTSASSSKAAQSSSAATMSA